MSSRRKLFGIGSIVAVVGLAAVTWAAVAASQSNEDPRSAQDQLAPLRRAQVSSDTPPPAKVEQAADAGYEIDLESARLLHRGDRFDYYVAQDHHRQLICLIVGGNRPADSATVACSDPARFSREALWAALSLDFDAPSGPVRTTAMLVPDEFVGADDLDAVGEPIGNLVLVDADAQPGRISISGGGGRLLDATVPDPSIPLPEPPDPR